jgi:carbon-monoxide dehydrogenase small subunit
MRIAFVCNGKRVEVDAEPGMRALDLIRDLLNLTGAKEGCGRGECGACTVLLNGKPVNACLLFAAKLNGAELLTVEGLSDGATLHPIQEAFLDEGAVQCGYCTPGMVLSAKALLDANPKPSREEIEDAVSGNFCRCTGYGKIVKAIERAAAVMRGAAPGGPT